MNYLTVRLLLVLTLSLQFITISASQQAPTPIPDPWMGSGTNPQQHQILTVGDFSLTTPYDYGSGVLVTKRMVLLTAHAVYSFDHGWVMSLAVMRANHGSTYTGFNYRPILWNNRRFVRSVTISSGYFLEGPDSLTTFNHEYAAVRVPRTESQLYNSFMRIEAAEPGSPAPFRERSGANPHIAQIASSSQTQKSIMCYPSGFYPSSSSPMRWKLHETYPQGRYVFTRRGPARDGSGAPNGYFSSPHVRVGGGCSGGSLQFLGGTPRTLLAIVVGGFTDGSGRRNATVRLIGTKILRFLRALDNDGY